MALSPFKTFAAGEILTAADLNSSFSYLTSNGLQLISPLTGSLDMDGQTLIMDSDADSSLRVATDDVLTMKLNNTDLFVWNGATASVVNGITTTAAIASSSPTIQASGSDTNIGLNILPKGTADVRVHLLKITDELGANCQLESTGGDLIILGAPGQSVKILPANGQYLRLGRADLHFPNDLPYEDGESLVSDASNYLVFKNLGYRALGSASASGTSFNLAASGLEALDTFNELVVVFNAISLSGTDDVLIQFADSSGFLATGYATRSATVADAAATAVRTATNGFLVNAALAGGSLSGMLTFRRTAQLSAPGGDTWYCSGTMSRTSTVAVISVAGFVTLSSGTPVRKVDGVRLRSSGTDTFDNGTAALYGRR